MDTNSNEAIIKAIKDITDTEKIVKTITGVIDAKTIYIFGSYAKGEQKNNSDIDIYVVANSINGKIIEKLSEITYALSKVIDKPIDVLLSTSEMFDKRKNFKASIERIVAKEGISLYAR
jgi:predicted nucleotidyltransferase